MGRKIFLILFICTTFNGCNYKLGKADRPDDLIPKDSFRLVLQDLMVLESYYSVQNINIRQFYNKIPKAADTVFQKYKIDTARFSRSMDYYAKKQKILIKIYQTIQDSLTLQSVQLEQNDSTPKVKLK